jgi:hypothetical protein
MEIDPKQVNTEKIKNKKINKIEEFQQQLAEAS